MLTWLRASVATLPIWLAPYFKKNRSMEKNRTLIILRHAKSSWEETGKSDFDRALKEKGIQDIRVLANEVKGMLGKIDTIYSSPANRATHTAILFAKGIGFPTEQITIVDELYETNELRLFEFVKELPKVSCNVVIVGHNPTSTDFVNLFLKDKIDNIPTSGIVKLSFDVTSWADISSHNLSSSFFDYPKNYQ